jgi:ADP-heptose:LPS heptosyltransferase
MTKKLLFLSAEGIGNCAQLIPCLRTIKEILGYNINYLHVFGNFFIPKIIPYTSSWFIGNQIKHINPNNYEGFVSTFWTRNHIKPFLNAGMNLLAGIHSLNMVRSEVDTYMEITRDLGAKEEDLIWHGNCMYNKLDRRYDIVIANGYNPHGSADWSIKSYPYYNKVVELLNKKYKICSVGSKQEYVKGTHDETGLQLLDTLGLIKNSKVLLSNDSGMYHCANALEVPNAVIFTATSISKNYDIRFHKYSVLIYRSDLECRPCQSGHKWKKCKTWECREIEPQVVVDAIEKLI